MATVAALAQVGLYSTALTLVIAFFIVFAAQMLGYNVAGVLSGITRKPRYKGRHWK